MDASIDFGKIAFNAVKTCITDEHAPELTDMIMDDFVAGGGFAKSFSGVADAVGQYIAEEIFGVFLTDEAVEEHSTAWENK